MPYTQDFVMDNVGSPDQYTVQTPCWTITLREKNRAAVTPATFNIYVPAVVANSPSYFPYEGGETYICQPGYQMQPGLKPFAGETVNVASATFVAREE